MKQIEITNQDGEVFNFNLHKFPPLLGREIVLGYPLSMMKADKEYKLNEDLMRKLMTCVSVQTGDKETFLTTDDLIINHCKDWYVVGCLELQMIKYNCSFLQNSTEYGSVQEMFLQKVANYIAAAVLNHAGKQ